MNSELIRKFINLARKERSVSNIIRKAIDQFLEKVNKNIKRETDSLRYQDKAFSLVDCTSFVIMKKYGIAKALAFDKNFEQAGFEVL